MGQQCLPCDKKISRATLVARAIDSLALSYMGISAPCSTVKRQGREANHSSPSSAQVKNMWSYTLSPPISLHGVVLRPIGHQEKL
jgi:hypothetical protein